jgi:hypothetical protein
MSAIDTTFHWVRNPTAINGLATTYVSKRGSDVSGDGTAQNPYASIAKATSVATANTNMMLDEAIWDEARTNNNRAFYWFGNGHTVVKNIRTIPNDYFYSIYFYENIKIDTNSYAAPSYFYHCVVVANISTHNWGSSKINAEDTIFINTRKNYDGSPINIVISSQDSINAQPIIIKKSIFYAVDFTPQVNYNYTHDNISNSILIYCKNRTFETMNYDNCNFTNGSIMPNSRNCINDSITNQTFADYFNKYDANDWLQCDFTAKVGSANIGAGEKGTTIGLNEGFTMYADNSANDVFKESNGAILRNVVWNNDFEGYVLHQKTMLCQGATSNTITLDSSASAVDDYYNNLFIGIVGGDGYGELFLISDYDGATKTATIDGTWTTTPTTNSIYTISGTILSAVKDLGKVIKVKRNWTFADNFTALQDGQWAEFMTHVGTNGKQFPVSCYSYEYSIDGVNFFQGQTADDLVSTTNGDNKVTDNIYGDCSANYDEATAKNLIMRYIRVRVHIGFNIGQLGE